MRTFLLLSIAGTLLPHVPAQAEPQNGPDHVGVRRPVQNAPRPMVRDEIPTAAPTVGTQAMTTEPVLIPIHSQEADPIGGAYGIWAAGTKYKVSFHGDMTFVPYLGADYPHNQPLSWHTTAVRHGDEQLLGSAETCQRQQGQLQYRYQFGRFTEIYDVRAEGLEQSFVITRPAAGGGDLVVEGRIDTALRATATGAAHQALQFVDEQGQLIMTYGEAYAIDAHGRKTNITTHLSGDKITLTVPATWLTDATWPVTVDPILTPVLLDWGTGRESVDICRDDSANDRMYVFIRAASTTDKDVYARIVEDDYNTGTYVFNDLNTSWSHRQIRVAAADSPQKYCAVFDRDFTSSNTSAIRYHVHDSGDLTLSTTVSFLAWTSSIQDWRADVGGTSLGSLGDQMLVVYQRDAGTTFTNTNNSEIWGSVIDITGTTPTSSTPFQINAVSSGDRDQERPAVNKQATPSSNTVWMCVWQEYWNANPTLPDDWDTAGRLVDAAGAVSAASWFTLHAANDTHHQLGPVVAGASGRYCVAYALGDKTLINFKTSVINGTSVNAERLDWSNFNGTATKFDETTLWGPHNDRRWRVGGIAYDNNSDSHWALSSLSDAVYSGTGSVYLDRVGYNGAGLEYATLFAAPANFNGDPGGVVFDDDNVEMATAWIQNDTTATPQTAGVGVHDIFATSFTYPTPIGAPTLSGTSCSSVSLSWSPSTFNSGQQIGSEFTSINYSGAPAASLHFVAVSLAATNALVINPSVGNGCRLLVDNGANFLGFMPLQIGTSGSSALPLPEWLPTMTLYFQDWYLDQNQNLFLSTQRLGVPITK